MLIELKIFQINFDNYYAKQVWLDQIIKEFDHQVENDLVSRNSSTSTLENWTKILINMKLVCMYNPLNKDEILILYEFSIFETDRFDFSWLCNKGLWWLQKQNKNLMLLGKRSLELIRLQQTWLEPEATKILLMKFKYSIFILLEGGVFLLFMYWCYIFIRKIEKYQSSNF